ncbi:MAG TPA: branched-chain amino acid ABC transporter permease [Thermodesulfobacteriota bacterium]
MSALRPVLLAAAAVLALAVPWLAPGGYALHLAIMAALYAALALSLNLLLGYAGQLSLGHVAYFGLGAYAAALANLELGAPIWAGLAAGGALAAAAGLVIGGLAFKVRGAYFVILTVSFAEVIRLIALNWMDVTQGPLGLPGITPFGSKTSAWFAALALAAASLVACHRIVRSRTGRALVALRENEPLARSIGIDVYRHLVVASALSAGMAGVAGGIYAHHQAFMSPEVFSFGYTVTMVIMVVAGGQGTLAGPVLGAILFTLLPEWLRAAQEWRLVVYAVILLAVVVFMPKGIVPTAAAWLGRRRPAGPAAAPNAAPPAAAAEPRQ